MVLPVVADIPTLKGETVADVHVNDKLSPEQQQQLRSLLQEYEDIFSDRPGTTSLIELMRQILAWVQCFSKNMRTESFQSCTSVEN